MRVNDVAKQLRVSPSTVRKYANEGRLKHELNPAGQRVFSQSDVDEFLGIDKTPKRVFYVRSSNDNKALMQSQIDELTLAYGVPIRVYSDSGSGLNENRVGLSRLLRDAGEGKFTQVCITYEDRLTRFGLSFIKQLLAKDKVEILVIHDKVKYSIEKELMQDFMNLLASFSGKFYRLRSKESQYKLLDEAKNELKDEQTTHTH